MKKTKKAFSLIIAIWLVMITIILAIIIVEYIIPFSRNIRWVENASIAYYLSYSGIENWLYYFKWREDEDARKDMSYSTGSISSKGYSFATSSSGMIIPAPWTWDSNFDNNWNKISMWNPIQLSIWYGFLNNINDFSITFKVPNIDWTDSIKLFWNQDNNIILSWQLSSENETLSADPEYMIKVRDINERNPVSLWNKEWRKVWWDDFWVTSSTGAITLVSATDFFSNCWDWNKCILRFTIVNPIKQEWTEISLPFLEWKVNTTSLIPLRYSRIESTWNSYWFSRILKVRYPQDTIPESLDFAIFQ